MNRLFVLRIACVVLFILCVILFLVVVEQRQMVGAFEKEQREIKVKVAVLGDAVQEIYNASMRIQVLMDFEEQQNRFIEEWNRRMNPALEAGMELATGVGESKEDNPKNRR